MAIRTWRASAKTLGMSEDTLNRERHRHGDGTPTPPWFADEQDVIAWYLAMRAPVQRTAPPSVRCRLEAQASKPGGS